jgi:4-oxalocrotonate tautomerase
MPVVTTQVTREGTRPGASSVTAEEKAALIKGASQLLLDVLNKPLDATYVIIEEVDTSNWGWGGLPALEYRQRRAACDSARSSTAARPRHVHDP